MYSRFQESMASRFTAPAEGQLVVADPDASVFMMVRQLTAPDRWQVAYASTPQELTQILRQGKTTMALVDLAMLEASEDLAEDLIGRSRRGLKVVVTTDEHNEANERRARTMGPVFYAPKPINIEILNYVLEGALEAAV